MTTKTEQAASNRPGSSEAAGIKGIGVAVLRGPDGEVKQEQKIRNLVTQVGDQMYGDRGSGAATPNAPTGMRLGTGTTAASKTGAGAAIGTYISGSNSAFESGFPASALEGSSRRISYECFWASGTATNTAIAEVVLSNETGITDAAGSAADTISRIVLGSTIDKQAGDTLTITLHHDLLGA